MVPFLAYKIKWLVDYWGLFRIAFCIFLTELCCKAENPVWGVLMMQTGGSCWDLIPLLLLVITWHPAREWCIRPWAGDLAFLCFTSSSCEMSAITFMLDVLWQWGKLIHIKYSGMSGNNHEFYIIACCCLLLFLGQSRSMWKFTDSVENVLGKKWSRTGCSPRSWTSQDKQG